MTAMTTCSNASTDSLQVTVGGSSSAGIRDINQDAFAVKLPSQSNVIKYKGVVACMADGVSCSENAQQASQTSVTQFIEDYYCTPDSWDVKKSAHRVINSLNNWLYHHGQQSDFRHNGLVTTFSSIIFKSNTAHLIHAGDSRIYRYRQEKLKQLTQDHCHKQNGRNSFLTRALGMDSHLDVDFQRQELELNDIFLLSTDGLHEWLSRTEIETALKQQQYDLEQVTQQLVTQAKNNGSNDNISCLVVKIEQLPDVDVDEIHRKLTQLVIPPVMEIGNKIDHFIVQRIIHSGTRSHVYLVENENNKQLCILKAPSPHFSEDLIYLEGFIREQWVGRRLHHPNIMKIEERPAQSPFLYHLCEYIEERTLRQWIHDNPTPNLNLVRDIAAELFKAVRAFQRMGMVHRDLKPENILITNTNKVVLIDFGTVQVDGLDEIASPLLEAIPMGAINYIAPEYLAGERAQHASDIFSLGVIIYEMLTGQLPYKPSNLHSISHSRVHNFEYQAARHYRKDIPQWLDYTLRKACHPSPDQRYQAMSELNKDLSTPNKQMLKQHQQAPLLERNPVFFWKSFSLILILIMLAETWLLLSS